jgi:hypothetical protein
VPRRSRIKSTQAGSLSQYARIAKLKHDEFATAPQNGFYFVDRGKGLIPSGMRGFDIAQV